MLVRSLALLSGLALAALTMLAPQRAAAVEVRLGESADPSVVLVELSGPIQRGDTARVQAFIANLPKGRAIAVNMHSPGGLIAEALVMGRYFHASTIRTYVRGPGRHCLSACALAFLGGRDALGRSFRVKGSDARIGFHGFRRNVEDKEFTIADMHEAVATTQQVILAIADYLTAVDADIEVMSMMLEAANASMSYMSNDKALAIGVHVLQEVSGRLVAPSAAALPHVTRPVR